MSTRLVLVRHGQTDWNAEGRLQGRSDIPLNGVGRAQARDAAGMLAGGPWDLLVSSPLVRATETADLIGAGLGLQRSQTVEGLLERDYGSAEGSLMHGLSEPEATRLLGAAETEEEVAQRGLVTLRDLLETYPDRAIIAVTHGTYMRLTLSALLGRPHPRISNGEAVEVELELLGAAVG